MLSKKETILFHIFLLYKTKKGNQNVSFFPIKHPFGIMSREFADGPGTKD